MKDKGFSLIEMVVVLVLLGLSVALVTPSLSRFSRTVELKGAAKRISAILRYSRSEAVHHGKVYQVLFDPELRQVKMQPVEEEIRDEEEGERREKKGTPKMYSLPAGVQIKDVKVEPSQFPSDLAGIEFYPQGGSNGGSILLEAPDLKGYRIKVHFLTGTVTIEQA